MVIPDPFRVGQRYTTYKVDPVHDLPPVCLNCHAVVCSRSSALSIEPVQAMYKEQQRPS
jgi:predicted HNH restriction endonuclease